VQFLFCSSVFFIIQNSEHGKISKKILVVDDDPDIVQVVDIILREKVLMYIRIQPVIMYLK